MADVIPALPKHICYLCGQRIGANTGWFDTRSGKSWHHLRQCPKPSQGAAMSAADLINIDTDDPVFRANRRMRNQLILQSNKPYFIVFNPTSGKPPTILFEDEKEAFRIAELMARKNPDECFYVMQSVGFSQTQQPVVSTRLLPPTIEINTNPKFKPAAKRPTTRKK